MLDQLLLLMHHLGCEVSWISLAASWKPPTPHESAPTGGDASHGGPQPLGPHAWGRGRACGSDPQSVCPRSQPSRSRKAPPRRGPSRWSRAVLSHSIKGRWGEWPTPPHLLRWGASLTQPADVRPEPKRIPRPQRLQLAPTLRGRPADRPDATPRYTAALRPARCCCTPQGEPGMPEFRFATTSAAQSSAAALILPVFKGPEAGPGVDEVGKALGVD